MASRDSTGAEHLAEQIRLSMRLLERLTEGDPALEALQHWQRARLAESYADLKREPRYRAACVFFLEELYGGRDMRQRDRQLERALPVMRRFLPDHLLHAVGEAMRLQWISMDLDARMAERLDEPIDQPAYARAYRELETWEERAEQIRLIESLGFLLIDTVRRPMIRRLVRWMHAPAVAAGFGKLQTFLIDGLDAFAAMHEDAEHFVETIVERETEALNSIRSGSDWPFEPWIGTGPSIDAVDRAD